MEQKGNCDVCDSVDVDVSTIQPNMLLAIHYKLTKTSLVCTECFKKYVKERGW